MRSCEEMTCEMFECLKMMLLIKDETYLHTHIIHIVYCIGLKVCLTLCICHKRKT